MGENSNIQCHICGNGQLMGIRDYPDFLRVSSDCKPWKRGGLLCVCRQCFSVQKKMNAVFFKEIEKIYNQYDAYHQADGGRDSVVFDSNSLRALGRSQSILDTVLQSIKPLYKGLLLDIGCGNGNLLKAASKTMPGWELYGFDIDESICNEIESIPYVKKCHSHDLEKIKNKFDLVFMMHVLEHIPYPLAYLEKVSRLIADNGYLIIEVPNLLENPFDLLIADHAIHFTTNTLDRLMDVAGFEIVFLSTHVIGKELTLIARKKSSGSHGLYKVKRFVEEKNISDHLIAVVDWLKQIKNQVIEIGKDEKIGLFGAGIASAWLIGEFPEKVKFCVDEDPNKIDKLYFDKPVLHPSEVNGETIFIPMPYTISQKIFERWIRFGNNSYNMPPKF